MGICSLIKNGFVCSPPHPPWLLTNDSNEIPSVLLVISAKIYAGALAVYAAKKYGVKVYGVTLSQPQVDFANERIKKAGLKPSQCRVELLDYRSIKGEHVYDKIAAIGIIEHIGLSQLETYFSAMWRLLKPTGVLLNHGISSQDVDSTQVSPFNNKYIFPDGFPVPLPKIVEVAMRNKFEVRDVDNLRDHYILTSRHWMANLKKNKKKVIEIMGEKFYRLAWIAMIGGVYRFEAGQNNLMHVLLYKPDYHSLLSLPLTRKDWYR